jgi:hypothetical protein
MRPPVRRSPRHTLLLPLLAVALFLGATVAWQQETSVAQAQPVLPVPPAGDGDRIVPEGDFVLTTTQVVEHDVYVVSGNATIEEGAEVKHDVTVLSGDIVIAGRVGHDVKALNGNITLTDSAVVGADVTALNGTVERATGAQVTGKVHSEQHPAAGQNPLADLVNFILRLLAYLVLGVVFVTVGTLAVLAWPRQTGRVVTVLEGTPWSALGVGLLTGVLILPVAGLLSVILAITIVGIILIPVLWLAVGVCWLYGAVVVGLWAGRRLAESGRLPAARNSLLVTAIAGLGVVALACALLTSTVAWIGWPVSYFLGFIGLGAVVLSRLGVSGQAQRTGDPPPRVTHPLTMPQAGPSDRRAS